MTNEEEDKQERKRAANQKYAAAHREELAQYQREYRKKYPERKAATDRKYLENNREKRNEYLRMWRMKKKQENQ